MNHWSHFISSFASLHVRISSFEWITMYVGLIRLYYTLNGNGITTKFAYSFFCCMHAFGTAFDMIWPFFLFLSVSFATNSELYTISVSFIWYNACCATNACLMSHSRSHYFCLECFSSYIASYIATSMFYLTLLSVYFPKNSLFEKVCLRQNFQQSVT